jgi:hypothetical protein
MHVKATICWLTLGAALVGCGEESPGVDTVGGAVLAGMAPVAFQSSGHELWIDTSSGASDTHLVMKSGTVPGQAPVSGGGIEVGVQASNGDFYDYLNGTITTTPGQMQAGTSPSITHNQSGQLAFGFHGINGHLWVSTGGAMNGQDTNAAMRNGTSPSVTLNPANSNNIAIAFQGSNQHFWLGLSPTDGHDSNGVMYDGTSPSIAAQPNNVNVAFAFMGSDQFLYVGTGDLHSGQNTGERMLAGTSPAVAVEPNGQIDVAYVQSDSHVCVLHKHTDNTWSLDILNVFGSRSPSIQVPPGGGYQVAVKGTNGHLWIILNGAISDELLSMD